MATMTGIKVCLLIFSVFMISAINGECPNIITKKMWGGRSNSDVDYLIIPVSYVIIEHTAFAECNTISACSNEVANIQNYHINTNKFHDIGYNFLIGGDGNVYEGVGWHKVGAHARSWNTKSIGIAFIGDFSDKLPPQRALDAAKNLIQCGVSLGELSPRYKLLGHRQVSATLSPGTTLYHEIVTWPHFSQDP